MNYFDCSVIIATYKRPQLVLDAIRSVKAQTLPVREIIVVVDDGSVETAAQIQKQFVDVRVIVQENRGRAVARNAGLSKAMGYWVAFLDDDDLWHSKKIAEVAIFADSNSEARAINHPVWLFAEKDDGPSDGFGFRRDIVGASLDQLQHAADKLEDCPQHFAHMLIAGNSFERLLERNCCVMSATVVTRELAVRAGCFNPSNAYCDDWSFFLNVARLDEWETIPKRLGFNRLHRGQSTYDPSNAVYILAAHIDAWLTGRANIVAEEFRQTQLRLKMLGPIYRELVQTFVWGALRHRKFQMGIQCFIMGCAILPRLRDKLYVLIPPPLTWRMNRFIAGAGHFQRRP